MITKRSNRWFVSPGGYFFTVVGLGDKDKKERKIGFSKHKTIAAVRLAEPEGRKRGGRCDAQEIWQIAGRAEAMRRLCRFTAGFVIGCAACVWFLRGSAWTAAAIGALAAVLAVCLLKTRRQGVRLTLLGFAISLVFCAGYRAVLLRPIEAFCAQNQAELHAEVLDYPTASRYGSAVLVKVKTGGAGMKAVLYYQQDAALSPGDQIFCTAKLRAASPDNLERDEYYASRGVWAVLSAKGQLTVATENVVSSPSSGAGGKAAQGRVPGGFSRGRAKAS